MCPCLGDPTRDPTGKFKIPYETADNNIVGQLCDYCQSMTEEVGKVIRHGYNLAY